MTDQVSSQNPRSVGDIPKEVTKASSLRRALIESMHVATERADAEACIYWALDAVGDNLLHPIFCLGPEDATSAAIAPGEGMVGRVFESQQLEIQREFDVHSDPATQKTFEHIVVRSAICVPLSRKLGCIQLINRKDGTPLSEQDADLLSTMVTFATSALEEDEPVNEAAMRHAQPIIVADEITRSFQNGDQVTTVLRGVNLNVYRGEFLAILGESGCGKSTFLNIIGGMDQADSGSFSFEGRDFSQASQAELTKYRRDNIGFVFQGYNLMPNLTALQNLQLIAELVDDPMDCREALRLVGLSHRMDQYPSQLSGGEQQRVSIARALVKKPKIIFADEPTAALDYATSIEVLGVLGAVVDLGTTLVMVTHNEEITRMANRVVRLRRGKTYEILVNRNPVDASALVW